MMFKQILVAELRLVSSQGEEPMRMEAVE